MKRAAAVIVTYFPDEHVQERIAVVSAEFPLIIVVDNGSPLEACVRLARWLKDSGGVWISNDENLGIGRALNQGIEQARVLGYEWAVTFDQDSQPLPEFSGALMATLEQLPDHDKVALIGSNIIENALKGRAACWLIKSPHFGLVFSRIPCGGHDINNVTMAITSGCLTRIAAWAQLGGFDETLFIDFVDTDYCLRAQRAGWTIAVSAQAQLQHSLGKRSVCQIAGIELRPTNHGPLRRYYIARNRIRMICRHGVHVPHWLVFEVCWTLYNLFRVLVAEKDLWRKFRAEIWGAWHGLRGKTGRAPEPVIRHFES